MVKKLMIDPEDVRRRETIEIGQIPVNLYDRSLPDEMASGNLSREDALAIWRDMVTVREFESMLDQIKKLGKYHETTYDHKGPAHLSIGQEGAAVGEAFLLGPEVHIFGSHRSHGEILAKGFTAIRKLPEEQLEHIMTSYLGGEILRVVEGEGAPGSVRELAVDYLLYGLLAEIFGRSAGFNRGMGGSMHAFFTPFGIYPNNAIVGGSADIAVGSALYKKVQKRPGFTIANIGDAAAGCGPVWEALNFAAMGQLRSLWDEEYRGGLKMVFAFMNNFYGMGGQTCGETMGFQRLSAMAAGLNPENFHAETIDGNNPLAVIDAFRRKIPLLEAGQGPVLLDILTYRQSGHSPSDASTYRERDEIQMWRKIDPVSQFSREVTDARVASEKDLEAMRDDIVCRLRRICRLAADAAVSPRVDLERDADAIARFMLSHEEEPDLPGIRPDGVLKPLHANSRVQAIAKKSRAGIDTATGKRLGENQAVSLRDGLFEAMIHHFYHDSRLVAYGEENRDWDGAFAVYRGMTESLPYHRLFNAPISEGAIIGTAVGYALEGGRALAELMYVDFMGRAGDELFNQLSKWQGMSGGELRVPVVVRISVGNKYGAQHSQDWTAMVAHVPGLKVVFPATPRDAKGLMASALRSNDPVIFFESQRIYGVTEWFHPEGVPEEYYTIPIGLPEVKRPGRDLTILSIGATLYRALEAAEILERDHNVSAELVDARSLVPFDYGPVLESVQKTGRLLVLGDACERASFMQHLAATVNQLAFDDLDAPVVTLGSRNWITPPAEMEDAFFPQPSWILDAIHAQILPLPGYTPGTNRTPEELSRIHRLGV